MTIYRQNGPIRAPFPVVYVPPLPPQQHVSRWTCPCARPSGDTLWIVCMSGVLICLFITTTVSFIAALAEGDECPPNTGLITPPRLWSIVHGSLWLCFVFLAPLPFRPFCRDGWVLRYTLISFLLIVGTALFIWIAIGIVTFIENAPPCLTQGTTAISAMVVMILEFLIAVSIAGVTSIQ